MPDPRIEQVDHTADAGFRIVADSLPVLFTTFAEQMVRLCCPGTVTDRSVVRPIAAAGHDLVELLINWLTEINSLMAINREVYDAFAIERLDTGETGGDCRLAGTALGEPHDPRRHTIVREIKAVTFHAAHVRREAEGWGAQVIFDL